MEQQQYLIDTNAVIDYLGEKLPASGMAFMNGVIGVNIVPFIFTHSIIQSFNNCKT